ncbi:MAG: pyridoxal phosphate-dependent aminotransferase [Pseudomonadota bacterium]
MGCFPHNDIISLVGETPRYDLGESVGPNLHVENILDAEDYAQLGALALGYGTAPGDGALREILAAHHNVGADDVVITAGGMQALFLLAFHSCSNGGEAAILSPTFPLARNVLTGVGARIRDIPVSFDDGYRVSMERATAAITAQTRLVCLTSPQNPSGVTIPKADIEAILEHMAELCPQAYLLIDETYREAAYDDAPALASFAGADPRIVTCASLSKCHGAPGLRLGWVMMVDPALREELVRGKFNTTVACAGVDEFLGLRVLQRRDDILGARRARLAVGLEQTRVFVEMNANYVEWVRPDAGALCCLRLKPDRFDDQAVGAVYGRFADADIRVGDGRWFGDAARVFRIGFGLPPKETLAEAYEIMSDIFRSDAHQQ